MRIERLKEIASQFDAMLIDQFGVIHDGQKLYAGAARVMAELHALGIPVVIMTNSGKRAQASITRTVKIGIPREYFVDCVSSGEVAFQTLPARKTYLIGRRGEEYGFDGTPFVSDPQDAEVILIVGSNAPETSLADYERLFRGLKIPAVCCNPDKLMFSVNGFHPAPGAIADVYENMGGKVFRIGKPFPEIYEFAIAKVPGAKRTLCVGDSPEHDVAGGRAAGLTTLMVQQGVSENMLEAEIRPYPDYVMKDFCW